MRVMDDTQLIRDELERDKTDILTSRHRDLGRTGESERNRREIP